MLRFALPFCLLASCTFFSFGSLAVHAAEPFRVVEMENRAHEFGNLSPIVLYSADDVAKISPADANDLFARQQVKELRDKISAMLKTAGIDFAKEALVLLPHTESSGSIKVTFVEPKLEGKKLTCRVDREVPDIGTDDLAFYAFAVVVDRSQVDTVVFTAPLKELVSLPVTEK